MTPFRAPVFKNTQGKNTIAIAYLTGNCLFIDKKFKKVNHAGHD
jgi:hypothetical protein